MPEALIELQVPQWLPLVFCELLKGDERRNIDSYSGERAPQNLALKKIRVGAGFLVALSVFNHYEEGGINGLQGYCSGE
jgi:hypothetical protein